MTSMPWVLRSPSPCSRYAGLLLVLAMLSTGCVSLTPPPGSGMNLRYSHGEADAPSWTGGLSEESAPEPQGPQRLNHRQSASTAVAPGITNETARAS
ncbi:MAG TPA: hypothetical protein VEU33_29255, partial [Archangium sp.]|nr:hypothetical protein [Archangium sp.]